MAQPTMTGAERSRLRGMGQQLEAALKIGRDGLTPAVTAEMDRLLHQHELIKVRFVNADRNERATLCEQVAANAHAECVGAVGHTALFYRKRSE